MLKSCRFNSPKDDFDVKPLLTLRNTMAKIDIIKIVAGIVLLRGATGSSTTSILLSSKFSLKFSELGLSVR